MYERIAIYIEEVLTSLRIDVSDAVYTRCMEELRSLREGRFERVSQSLENLRALVNQLHSRLVLVEDSRLDSSDTLGEGCLERPASARRSDARPFPSAEQMRAFFYIAAQLNSTRRRVRQMERTPTAASPVAPPIGPSGTVPPNTYGAQELEPYGANANRPARGDRTRMDATFASKTQALPQVAGCSALTRLPQSRGTDGPHVYTTCNRVHIPRVTVYVYHVYPCDYSPGMAWCKLCRRTDSLSLHVYACIITLYRGYCVQYSTYAGTPVFITVFYLIIIN